MKRQSPETASPIIRQLFEEIDRQGVAIKDIQKKSGIHPVQLSSWRHGRVTPLMTNIEVLAQVMGYRIVLEKI